MKIWDHNGEFDFENPLAMHFSNNPDSKPYLEGNVAYALIIDGKVIDTSVANPTFWNIINSEFSVVDVTAEHDVDSENAYVLKFIVNSEEVLTVGVTKRCGAIFLSDPTIVVLDNPELHSEVEPGWEYADGEFFCPPDFDPYSDEHY